ncbi:LysM peptidoglycan-binding domain-containing protein [Subtercola boreus]|uniref:LysM peptidoglycan-binding domain-containing protein n=1 Tax=Subtercola boreus TaxID=120213 RepID=UPI001558737F|nr:LysM peptidoglycan-binding domain-containing protein [Subtercola boreus]
MLPPAADSGPDSFATGKATKVNLDAFTHTVAQGDTVLGIGGRFGVCYVDLYSANTNLEGHAGDLEVGQSLKVVRDNTIMHDPDLCLATDIIYTG